MAPKFPRVRPIAIELLLTLPRSDTSASETRPACKQSCSRRPGKWTRCSVFVLRHLFIDSKALAVILDWPAWSIRRDDVALKIADGHPQATLVYPEAEFRGIKAGGRRIAGRRDRNASSSGASQHCPGRVFGQLTLRAEAHAQNIVAQSRDSYYGQSAVEFDAIGGIGGCIEGVENPHLLRGRCRRAANDNQSALKPQAKHRQGTRFRPLCTALSTVPQNLMVPENCKLRMNAPPASPVI